MSSLQESSVVSLFTSDRGSGVQALTDGLLVPGSGGEEVARSLFLVTGGWGGGALLDLSLSSVVGSIS